MPNTPLTVLFPGAADDADSLGRVENRLAGALNGAITAAAVAFDVTFNAAPPATGVLTIESEIVLYTARALVAGLRYTLSGVTRGAQGTAAAAHADGTTAEALMTRGHYEALRAAILALEAKVGILASTPPAPAANQRVGLKATAAGQSQWAALAQAEVITALGYTPANVATQYAYQVAEFTAVNQNSNVTLYTTPNQPFDNQQYLLLMMGKATGGGAQGITMRVTFYDTDFHQKTRDLNFSTATGSYAHGVFYMDVLGQAQAINFQVIGTIDAGIAVSAVLVRLS